MPEPDTDEQNAIFDKNGPIEPNFMHDAVQTLMRNMPLGDPSEPAARANRRMMSALFALSALHPRSEIEVMLGVQALCAYQAAAACWRIGMNVRRPNGDSTRHFAAAASSARTFDTLLKAIERRQAKPLSVPIGRPQPRIWADIDPTRYMRGWEDRCAQTYSGEDNDAHPIDPKTWTPEEVAFVTAFKEQDRVDRENRGLDIANTEGILPGGGMIMPEEPTPHQQAYLQRRLTLMYVRERDENLRHGIKTKTEFRPIRPGHLIP